jgi:type IV pilus assembly protein PilB
MNDSLIKQILLQGSYVTESDIKKAEKYALDRNGSFIDFLISEEVITKEILGQAMAESYAIPFTNLNVHTPSKENILLIPEDKAKKIRAIIIESKASKITVTTDDPRNELLYPTLSTLFPSKKVTLTYSLPEQINEAFSAYNKGLDTTFSKIIESKGRAAPEIVEQIIEDAILLKSSDIHCEPQEKEVIIRFRIDGVLQQAGKIPKEYYENILNRLKVQAKLRIDEHFSSQDGAIRFSSKNHPQPVDLRVSIVPTLDGEKVAIRILSSYIEELTLSNIGLSDDLQDQIIKSAQKPFGMILVTGPTGSGKTTTLYSLIRMLNTRETNITTIEDPVEYKIQGINQIQANSQTNLTFAKGLRAIARQDPNVILVGEIRDLETADIAVNAALTGHLLLTTFHANNAATAIPRFIDMGVEPFLVGSTIELIIAQRLVRKICESCKVSQTVTQKEIEKFGPAVSKYFTEKSVNLYRGKGCEACSHTGYRGRIGVFEFITTSSDLQDLIGKNASTKEIKELALKQGFKSMFEDGIYKVKTGATTIKELLRVINPE